MDRDEEIRRIAYQIWLDQGCPPEREIEHWLKAEKRVVRTEIALVKERFETEKTKLAVFVEEIDKRIIECYDHLAHYRRLQEDLKFLNEKILGLKARPSPIRDSLPTLDLGAFIGARMKALRLAGEI